MTIGYALLWIVGMLALTIVGSKGGLLLLLSRAIDNLRAAIRCAELSASAARWEWARQWSECVRWARTSR